MAGQLEESYAGLERKVEERTRELTEALEQQTATAEILRVISRSPTDVQPVLPRSRERGPSLRRRRCALIERVDGEGMRRAAHYGSLPDADPAGTLPVSRRRTGGRVAVLDRRVVHDPDMLEEPRVTVPGQCGASGSIGYRTVLVRAAAARGHGHRCHRHAPMEVRPFTDGRSS